MRGQSPMNCEGSDVKAWGQTISHCLMTNEASALCDFLDVVKEWGQNISHCLMTNEASALFHFLDVINECKGNNKI